MNENHGTTAVERQGSLIRARVNGAFNLAGAMAGLAAVEQLASELAPQPWVKLVDMRGCVLGTPDTLPLIERHNLWCTSHGCVAIGLVVDYAMVEHHYLKQSASCGLPIRSFDRPQAAEEWLLCQLERHCRQQPR